MLPDVTKETTLVMTCNYAKDGCPSNILHEAVPQSEKHTKWLSPCVTAVALAYLLPWAALMEGLLRESPGLQGVYAACECVFRG